jgi:hypothetical protein
MIVVLTEAEEERQHRLYMAAHGGGLTDVTDVGDMLCCRAHRRPLLECEEGKCWRAEQEGEPR